MKNVRGCADPSNEAEDKRIDIDGVFNATNPAAVAALCGARAADVTKLLDAQISQVLVSASHPEFGCNAAYERVVPKNSDLYNVEVRGGGALGQDGHGVGRVQRQRRVLVRLLRLAWGLETMLPAVRGGDRRPAPEVHRGPDREEGLEAHGRRDQCRPIQGEEGVGYKGPAWSAAVQKFTQLVGTPNCVGEEAESGICAIIDITKEDCLSINRVWDWSRQMEWVVDDTHELGGFCKKRNAYWDGFHIHGHTENVQEECEAIVLGMQGACADSTMPNGVHQFKPESECTGETETWHSFASHVVGGYRLVSQKIHVLEETSGNWVEAVRHGERDKCTLQTTCNWDPDNRITTGDPEEGNQIREVLILGCGVPL